MSPRALAFFVVGAVQLVASCAAPDATVEPREKGEFRTGSNIPRHNKDPDGVTVYDAGALERAQNGNTGLSKGVGPGGPQ